MHRLSTAALLCFCSAACSARAGDECSSPTRLTLGIAAAGRTDGSAPTPGIPAGHCGGTSELGPDEWFIFTAPAGGSYTFTLCDSAFDTVLSLWTGCPDGVRTPVACDDDSCGFGSRIVRTMAAGETLLARLAGKNNFYGQYHILVDAPMPPPVNDDCEDALPIGLGSVVGATTHATIDGVSSCPSNSPDVWYAFTAPATGVYTFHTCDILGFDTVLSLFDGCAREIVCNNVALCRPQADRSAISRSLRGGQSVKVRVAGFVARTGTFVLTVAEGGPPGAPPNDECAGALPIAEGQYQPFDATYATTSGLRPSGCGRGAITLQNDLYYAYTPRRTGEATITTCGTSWDTILAVYERCGGRLIACNDDDTRFVCISSSGQSVLTFPCVEGRPYTLVVGASIPWHDGRGVLSVACVAPPGCPSDFNDDGFVDHFDHIVYNWCFIGQACPPGRNADFNADGFVDFFDYDDFMAAFEAGC